MKKRKMKWLSALALVMACVLSFSACGGGDDDDGYYDDDDWGYYDNQASGGITYEDCGYCDGTGKCLYAFSQLGCHGSGSCRTCNGTGNASYYDSLLGRTYCSTCKGTGLCTECNGTGLCSNCDGTGRVVSSSGGSSGGSQNASDYVSIRVTKIYDVRLSGGAHSYSRSYESMYKKKDSDGSWLLYTGGKSLVGRASSNNDSYCGDYYVGDKSYRFVDNRGLNSSIYYYFD